MQVPVCCPEAQLWKPVMVTWTHQQSQIYHHGATLACWGVAPQHFATQRTVSELDSRPLKALDFAHSRHDGVDDNLGTLTVDELSACYMRNTTSETQGATDDFAS